jgi:fibronectin-binding autotransporter adhesin
MKPKFYTQQRHSSLIQSIVLTLGMVGAAGTLFLDTAHAADSTWQGPGTDLNTAGNWANGLPTASGDTASWNGTQAGNLSLNWSNTFGSANNGTNLNITGTQVGNLLLGGTSGTLAVGNITIANGAGAFTLGDGVGSDDTVFRNPGGVTTNTFTNNSANTATFASNLTFNSGGAATGRSLVFAGSGNWAVNGNLVQAGGGSFTVTKNGAGTLNLAAANGYSGVTTIAGGILNAASFSNYGVAGSLGNRDSLAEVSTNIGIRFMGGTLQYTGSTAQSTNRQIRLGANATNSIDASGTGSGTLSFTHSAANTDLFDSPGTRTLTLTGSNTGNNTFAIRLENQSANATSLTKSGAGTWLLTGASTYTGTTTINQGILNLGGGTATGSVGSSPLVIAGGALAYTRTGNTTQAFASTSISSGASTLSAVTGNTLNLATISRTAGATVNLDRTSGNGTIQGTATLANSILPWATVSNTGTAAANSANGVTFATITGGALVPYTAATSSSFAWTSTNPATQNYDITGPGGGGNTLGVARTANSVRYVAAADVVQNYTVTLTLNALMNASANSLTMNGGTLAVGNSNELILSAAAGPITIGMAITGASGAVTKTGANMVTLTGTNTYAGATRIADGTLRAGSSTAFNNTSALVMGGTGALDLNGFNAAFNGNVVAGSASTAITDNAAGTGTSTVTFNQSTNASVSTAALITDGASRKVAVAFANNNGAQQFTNANNTFSGGLTLLPNATDGTRMHIASAPTFAGTPGALTSGNYGTGTITVGQASTDKAGIYISAGNITLANAVVANTGLGTDRVGTFRIDSTGHTFSGELTAGASDFTLSTNGTGAVNLTGKITGNNGLKLLSHNQGGSSLTVTLSNAAGTNDYAGNTTINENAQSGRSYTLVLGADNQLPNGAGKGNVVINTNGTGVGTLNLNGRSDTINGLSGNGTVTSTAPGASVLTLGDGDASSSFSGTISQSTGTVAISKIGSGTQTLASTGTYTYTGNTSVTAGTLLINGNISTSALATVSGTGTLGGDGFVGNTRIQTGGTLSPGNSIGTLGINGDLTLDSGSFSFFEIDTAGDLSDLAIVTGLLTFGGTLDVNNVGSSLVNGDVFNLFDWGTVSGTFSTVNLPALDPGLTWDQSQLYTAGTLSVIPEPSTLLLGSLGLLALLRRKRA